MNEDNKEMRLLLIRPIGGWTKDEGVTIARFITRELGAFLDISIEIVHLEPEDRDQVQLLSDEVAFRVRSSRFDQRCSYSVGGIVSVRFLGGVEADAIVFVHVFGDKVQAGGQGNNLELHFKADAANPGHSWSVKGWGIDEYDEYVDYDFDYFASLELHG